MAAAGVPSGRTGWYLRWARDFAVSLTGIPLRERTPGQVAGYLKGLDERQLKSWQVAQARDALEILYRDHLGVPMEMPAEGSAADDPP